MLIWITRTAPDNLLTARRVRALGHRPLVIPALQVRPIAQPPLGFVPDALVFTSANGVRHHRIEPALAHVPVFTVGNHTADVAALAGYHTVTSANSNVEALKHIMAAGLPPGAKLVHYCARETAGDLPSFLGERGFGYTACTVYETLDSAEADIQPARRALARVGGIVVHSAKGARRASSLIRELHWGGTVWCMSPACARQFRGIRGVKVETAAAPTERALLGAIPSAKRGGEAGPAHGSFDRLRSRVSGLTERATNDNGRAGELRPSPAGSPDDPENPPPGAA